MSRPEIENSAMTSDELSELIYKQARDLAHRILDLPQSKAQDTELRVTLTLLCACQMVAISCNDAISEITDERESEVGLPVLRLFRSVMNQGSEALKDSFHQLFTFFVSQIDDPVSDVISSVTRATLIAGEDHVETCIRLCAAASFQRTLLQRAGLLTTEVDNRAMALAQAALDNMDRREREDSSVPEDEINSQGGEA